MTVREFKKSVYKKFDDHRIYRKIGEAKVRFDKNGYPYFRIAGKTWHVNNSDEVSTFNYYITDEADHYADMVVISAVQNDGTRESFEHPIYFAFDQYDGTTVSAWKQAYRKEIPDGYALCAVWNWKEVIEWDD